jgi:TolB protein
MTTVGGMMKRGLLLIAAIAVLIACGLAVLVSPSQATFRGTNGLLVYQLDIANVGQLLTVRPDGSAVRRVTRFRRDGAIDASWAPDGKRIAFTRDFAVGAKKEHLDIYTMNADGGGLHAFGLKGLNAGPIWSPDGRRIFWVSRPGLRSANPDGTGIRLIRLAGDYASPTFSPDGRRIALIRDVAGDRHGLEVVDVDGTHARQLIPPSRGVADGKIDWSPDGSRIVFSSPEFELPGKSSNVYTIRPDGTGLVQLTHDRGGKVNNGADTWSPDGTKIAFISNRSGEYRIYVMNTDGTGVAQLVHRPGHLAAWGTHP